MTVMDIVIICAAVLLCAPVANSQDFDDLFGGGVPGFGTSGLFSTPGPTIPPVPSSDSSGTGFGDSFDFANAFQPLEFGSSISSPADTSEGEETIQDKFVSQEQTGINTLNRFLPSVYGSVHGGDNTDDIGEGFGDAFGSIRNSFSPSNGFGFDLGIFGN